MSQPFGTRGRGPVGVPTNSPISDSGTSARIQNKPNVTLGAVSADDAIDGKPRRGTGGDPGPVAQLPELQMGSRGDDVTRLQCLLNSRLYGGSGLKIDGRFGPKTRAAVVEFQKKSQLAADGIVGRKTWFSLVSASPANPAVAAKPAAAPKPAGPTAIAGSAPTQTSDVYRASPAATEESVDDWSLEDRFKYVLLHTGGYLRPDLRAQFAALLTPTNLTIMIGCLVVWAAGHFCGVSEFTDAFLLGFGLVFMGRAVFDAARYLKNFLELTCTASTETELDDAASYLAQAISIIGVVAFFALLARVARAVGKASKAADEAAAAAPKEEAPPPAKAEPPERAAEPKPPKPPQKASNPFSSGKTPKASEIEAWAKDQGWTRSQTPNGPIKYTDANGVVRVTIKSGSPRAPGSGDPHVELRNTDGQRVDPQGNPVTRRSPDNHTPIDWDL